MVYLNQEQVNNLVQTLNHKVSSIEKHTSQIDTRQKQLQNDVKWMKKIGYFMSTMLAGIFVSVLGVILKLVFNVI
ncbi:MAG: hypothetical protein IH948_00025 [Bacteroidetes bacterium]|nr:hypothetical protein [Bacteroidota bacterium]